jgi:hypothetical protein
LFRGVLIAEKGKKKTPKALLEKTVKLGFIFSPEVIANYSVAELEKIADSIKSEVGISAEEINSSFHKSWKKIKEASIEQLVMEQIVHYITTYGFEQLGIYDEKTVFIPDEALKIPKVKLDKIKLTVIKGYTKEEIKEKVLNILKSGIALSEDSKRDILDISTSIIQLEEKEINDIKNKEVRIAFFDYFGIVPAHPIEFLRYIIYKSTNKTLLIKNKALIAEIKSKDNLAVLGLFNKYAKKHGLEKLAEIFLRFKPLFLAFRTNKGLKTVINKIRKLAEKYHKPMPEDFLNNVTAYVKKNKIDENQLKAELSRVNIFRKIRLAYALKFRTKDDLDSIMYKIRNGKSYATEFDFGNKQLAEKIFNIVVDSIAADIRVKVDGKKIFMPKNIEYALPATEKQFIDNFPAGTFVTVPKDLVIGVYWENVNVSNSRIPCNHRIDLDLSLVGLVKFGWDSYYRNSGTSTKVLFSGDMTDAQNGASELFYIKKQETNKYSLMLNYFNFDEHVEVPFKLIIASEKVANLPKNYMVDPNNIIAAIKLKISERQKILGLLITEPTENKFFLMKTEIGNTITSRNNTYTEQARKYMINFYSNSITLREVLEKAGAKIVDKAEKCDINLSPETLEKDSILNLLV